MRHAGTVRLETPRLVLRRFREDDAEPAFRNWESDEKVTEPAAAQESPGAWERAVRADPLLSALAAEAFTPGELTAYFDFSAAELHRRLACYEMRGLVERGRDGRYQAVRGIL